MWPSGALADILRSMKGSRIETSMSDYEEYLDSRGANTAYWNLDSISLALDSGIHSREVIYILELMKSTSWSDEFDNLHGIIDIEYGPELADMFNVYNMLHLLKFRGSDMSNGYVCRAH